MTSITPFLWFDTDLSEPIAFYTSIFPDSRPGEASAVGGESPIFSATIELAGQKLMMLNGGPAHAGFTESISLFVSVDTQAAMEAMEAMDRLDIAAL